MKCQVVGCSEIIKEPRTRVLSKNKFKGKVFCETCQTFLKEMGYGR